MIFKKREITREDKILKINIRAYVYSIKIVRKLRLDLSDIRKKSDVGHVHVRKRAMSPKNLRLRPFLRS